MLRAVVVWFAAAVAWAPITFAALATHISTSERTPVCRHEAMADVCAYTRWAFTGGFIATVDVVGPLVCPAASPRHALARAEAGDWYCWGASRLALVSEVIDVEELEAAP